MSGIESMQKKTGQTESFDRVLLHAGMTLAPQTCTGWPREQSPMRSAGVGEVNDCRQNEQKRCQADAQESTRDIPAISACATLSEG